MVTGISNATLAAVEQHAALPTRSSSRQEQFRS